MNLISGGQKENKTTTKRRIRRRYGRALLTEQTARTKGDAAEREILYGTH
jgi:hypothetical protein